VYIYLYRRKRSVAIVTAFLITSLLYALTAAADEQSEQAKLASHSLLLDITRADARLVTIGERGHVLISDNNGQSWEQILVPTRSQLTAVYFLDDRHGWAVGHDAVILFTNDGGQNNGFAIGAYGLFLSTNDGGTSWDRRQISDDDFHLNSIASLDSNVLVIAAEQGHLYRSVDGGYSWSELTSPYAGSFFGITLINDDFLLVFGLRGNLYSSTDRGENWQKIDSGTEASLMAALTQKNGTIRVVGLGGNILTSTDQGKSFSLRVRNDRKALTSILETADGQLVMSGSAGITIESGDSK
jgi:photosystem II stability/assembly factor-like uncharacterized protein